MLNKRVINISIGRTYILLYLLLGAFSLLYVCMKGCRKFRKQMRKAELAFSRDVTNVMYQHAWQCHYAILSLRHQPIGRQTPPPLLSTVDSQWNTRARI
jgi:hypothetical protein